MSAILLARARRDQIKPTQNNKRFHRRLLVLAMFLIAAFVAFGLNATKTNNEPMAGKRTHKTELQPAFNTETTPIGNSVEKSPVMEVPTSVNEALAKVEDAKQPKGSKIDSFEMATASTPTVRKESVSLKSERKLNKVRLQQKNDKQSIAVKDTVESDSNVELVEKTQVVQQVPVSRENRKQNTNRQSIVTVNNHFVNYQKIMKLVDAGSYSQALNDGKAKLNRFYLEKLYLQAIERQTELSQLTQLDKTYRIAISEFPHHKEIHIGYMRHLLRQGKNDLVVKKIQTLTRSLAKSIEVNQLHAAALIRLGDYQAAAEIYRKLISQQPNNPQWLLGLAMCFENLGDKRGAILIYRNTLRRDLGEVISRAAIEDKLVLLERSL